MTRLTGYGLGLLAALGCAVCGVERPALEVRRTEFAARVGSLAPHLARMGDRALLSWLEPTGGRRHALRVAVRTAGGWAVVGTVVESDSLFVNWADVPGITPLGDGTWLAHWLQRTGPGTYAYHVRMARSTDGGRTWGPAFRPHTDTSETEHGFVSLVAWTDGAVALWLDGRQTIDSGPMTLYSSTVTADGPGPDLEVDPRVCDCCQTALARTARGLVAAYRDRSDTEVRDIAVRRFEHGAWSAPVKVADDAWQVAGCPVNGPAVDARGDTVAVAWFTAPDGTPRVYVAFSTDGGASFGPRVAVDEGRPAGRVDIAWWGARALVSWIEETDDAGDVRVREIGLDGTATRSTRVAATRSSRAAGFPRLAVVDRDAFVAWTQPGDSGGVRVTALGHGR